MKPSLKYASGLLFLIALLLASARLYAFFPFLSMLLISSGLLSSWIFVQILSQDEEAAQLLQRQNERTVQELEHLRACNKNISHEKEQIFQENAQLSLRIQEAEQQQQRLSEEASTHMEHELLFKERASYLQRSLEEALEELKVFHQREHFEAESLQAAHLLKHQLLQLRQQFEQKGLELKEARRALFDSETERLTILRKQEEERLATHYEADAVLENASLLTQEHAALLEQTEALEELVTHLSNPKKRGGRKKANPLGKMLELQF